jgi:putative oxidoreductase
VPFFLAAAVALELAAGVALLVGWYARPAAAALILFLVPTTLIFHDFWQYEGRAQQEQMIHFMKNLGLLGGLVLAAADTGGAPSLGWRARRAARRVRRKVS